MPHDDDRLSASGSCSHRRWRVEATPGRAGSRALLKARLAESARQSPWDSPGAVRPVAKSDVCAVNAGQAFAVPVALQRRVFEEYGIRNTRPDYLITPELGGASDIRNLWPQPYSSTVWNARGVRWCATRHRYRLDCRL